MKPKVSVIIPTYNRAQLIGKAIKSILEQSYQNFEIIIIDDSPNDETEKVVKEFNEKKIKYIHNEIKTNLPRARNQGVKESSSDSQYIAFLDDDDEWLPEFLEETIKILEREKNLSVVISYAELRNRAGEILEINRCDRSYGQAKFWEQSIGGGAVIRKEIFTEENFWYDERKVCEDLDFGIRVLKDHQWKCLAKVLRIYYGYPLATETSLSTALPLDEIERFYQKHFLLYSSSGKEAYGFFHFFIGKLFCQSKEIKKGRENLKKAFLINPKLKYLFYYLVSLFYPKFFQSIRIRSLKHKIFKGKL